MPVQEQQPYQLSEWPASIIATSAHFFQQVSLFCQGMHNGQNAHCVVAD
jgi:hypothetical protein